jgi:hypothetical protein
MKFLRPILAFITGALVSLWPTLRFFRITHHADVLAPASAHYIAITALIGMACSLLGGWLGARIAPTHARGVGDAIAFFIILMAAWSLYQSPGREHWVQLVAILLMAPAAYLGSRLLRII